MYIRNDFTWFAENAWGNGQTDGIVQGGIRRGFGFSLSYDHPIAILTWLTSKSNSFTNSTRSALLSVQSFFVICKIFFFPVFSFFFRFFHSYVMFSLCSEKFVNDYHVVIDVIIRPIIFMIERGISDIISLAFTVWITTLLFQCLSVLFLLCKILLYNRWTTSECWDFEHGMRVRCNATEYKL